MTLNGVMAIMLHYFTELGSFGAIYIKAVAVRPMLAVTDKLPKESSFWQHKTMTIFSEITEKEYVKGRYSKNCKYNIHHFSLNIAHSCIYIHVLC